MSENSTILEKTPPSTKAKKGTKKKKKTKVAEPPKEVTIIDPDPEDFLDYQLGPKLGRGAFGCVYQGWDKVRGAYVAIKTISLKRFPDALKGVQQEIALMEPLEDPNIIKYISSHITENFLYIVMEFAEGGSLQHVQKKFQNFDEHLAATYLYQVLLGLKYLHEQSIIHRDIKAANILLTNNIAKLSDFGISVKLTDNKNSDADFVCSPYWAAPEVISMEPITEKCDIWSLGITAIEIFTGTPPYFELNPMRAMFQIVQNPEPPLPKDITPEFKDFLTQCLTKNVGFRKNTEQLIKHSWIQHHINGPVYKRINDSRFTEFQDNDNANTLNFETLMPNKKKSLKIGSISNPSQFNPEDDDSVDNKPTNKGGIKTVSKPLTLDSLKEDSEDDFGDMKPINKVSTKPATKPLSLDSLKEDSDDFGDMKPINKVLPKFNSKPLTLGSLKEDSDDDFSNFKLESKQPSLLSNNQKSPNKSTSDSDGALCIQPRNNENSQKNPDIHLSLLPKPASSKLAGLSLPGNRGSTVIQPNAPKGIKNIDDLFTEIFTGDEDRALQKEADLFEEALKHLDFLVNATDFLSNSEEHQDEGSESYSRSSIALSCTKLIEIFSLNPKLKGNLSRRQGIIPLYSIIQSKNSLVLEHALPLVNEIIRDQPKILKSLCILGILPYLIQYSIDIHDSTINSRLYGEVVQELSLKIIAHICRIGADPDHPKKKPIQMFISAGGLPGIAEIFKHNKHADRPKLTPILIEMVSMIFKSKLNTPKSSLSRILAQSGLIDLLGIRFADIEKDHPSMDDLCQVLEICSQADSHVKIRMAQSQFIENLFSKAKYPYNNAPYIQEHHLKIVISCINNIAMDKTVAQVLWSTSIVNNLLAYLQADRQGFRMSQTLNLCFSALFHMSRVLTSENVPKIAPLLPLLVYILQHESTLKELATTVFLEFIKNHSSDEKMRVRLLQHSAIKILFQMFNTHSHKEQILGAFEAWASHHPTQIEHELIILKEPFALILSSMLSSHNSPSYLYDISNKVLKLLDSCHNLSVELSNTPLIRTIAEVLNSNSLSRHAEIRLEYINMLIRFYEATDHPKMFIARNRIDKIARKYLKDTSDSVKGRALRLLRSISSNYIL